MEAAQVVVKEEEDETAGVKLWVPCSEVVVSQVAKQNVSVNKKIGKVVLVSSL